VDINKSWRHGLTRRLYYVFCSLHFQSAERDDAIACDGNICRTRCLTRAINHLATLD
jgi:hypothetical protein